MTRTFGSRPAHTWREKRTSVTWRIGAPSASSSVVFQSAAWSTAAYSEFEVFDRQTFQHKGTFRMQSDGADWTGSTDGIDVFQGPGTEATGGIFAACDGCGRYGQPQDELDITGWDQIAKALGLRTCPNGQAVAEVAAGPEAERPVVPLVGTFATDYRNRSLKPRTIVDAGRATFLKQDLFESDFSKATVITMFLLPDINLRLRPTILKLKPGTRIVSNSFPMGDWEPDRRVELTQEKGCETSWCTALLWIVPANVAGTHKVAQGDLKLEQKYQMLTGTLTTDGTK